MAITDTSFITESEFYDFVKSPREPGDANVQAAIAAASADVRSFCGRTFYQSAPAAVRYFMPDPAVFNSFWLLDIDDIATLSGLTVQSDSTGQGNYTTTWSINTDFIAQPVNQSRVGIFGWPYDKLQAVGDRLWPRPISTRARPTVKITATFGWAAIPEPVKLATKIVANQNVALGGAALGVAGFDGFGAVRVRDIPQVVTMLTPYQMIDTFGIG